MNDNKSKSLSHNTTKTLFANKQLKAIAKQRQTNYLASKSASTKKSLISRCDINFTL